MRKRKIKKNFWFNDGEVKLLKMKAKKVGLTESELIRKLITGYEPREKPDDRFYEAIKLMRSISNSLNQIARKTNALGFIDAPYYQKEANKWNKFISEIKEEYLSPNIAI